MPLPSFWPLVPQQAIIHWALKAGTVSGPLPDPLPLDTHSVTRSLSKYGARTNPQPPLRLYLKDLIRTFDQQLPAFSAQGPLMAWC